MKKLIFNIDVNDHSNLKIMAKEEDQTISQVLRKLVKGYLLAGEIVEKEKKDRK